MTIDPGIWEQLNRCPECDREMQRDLAVGERLGLFYICPEHGRFRFSWDHNRLEKDEGGRKKEEGGKKKEEG